MCRAVSLGRLDATPDGDAEPPGEAGAMDLRDQRFSLPRVAIGSRVSKSQILTTRSHAAVARCFPSGLNAKPKQRSVWAFRAAMRSPVAKLKSITLPSASPDAKVLPSGEIAALWTGALCPTRSRRSLPLAVSQSLR